MSNRGQRHLTLIPGQHYDPIEFVSFSEQSDYGAFLANTTFNAHWIVAPL
ncbi:hypothetical protein [Komagataeibacter sp. SM21]